MSTAVSNGLLAVGYPLALAAGARLVPALRHARHGRLALISLGMGSIVAGHAMAGRVMATAVNAVAAAGLGVAWAASTRRSRSGPRPDRS